MTEFARTAVGDRLAYERYGTGGPGVVFIAGAGPHRATDPIPLTTARRLGERGATTLVFDRLGRGESHAAGVLDLDRELAAIATAIDLVGGSAVLVGHSSGGALALLAATRRLPVDALVLWETPIAGDPRTRSGWAERFEELLDQGRLEEAQAWYMRDMPSGWLERARSSAVWPSLYGQAASLRADAQALRWAESAPLAELVRSIRTPVLSIVGTETFELMTRSSAVIVDAIPQATAEVLPGANHRWEVEPMVERLHAFLETLDSS